MAKTLHQKRGGEILQTLPHTARDSALTADWFETLHACTEIYLLITVCVCEGTNWWNVGGGELTIAIFVCSTVWGFLYGSQWLTTHLRWGYLGSRSRRCGADGVVVSGGMMTWLLKAAAWDGNIWLFTCIWEFYVFLWSLMSVFMSSLFH